MRAEYIVRSNTGVAGYVVDGKYVKYYEALRNVDLIENLYEANGRVAGCTLPSMSLREVNILKYNELCSQNMLQRDVQKELSDWREKWSTYVLYLTGARQTGKTTELLKFAYAHYEQVIYVNLADETSLRRLEQAVSESLRFGMIRYCQDSGLEEYVNDSSTILIIDEVQESTLIYNSIRALQQDLECQVAVTGSYLGKTLNSEYFKPAGNVLEIEMLPLSFTEFCRAFDTEGMLQSIDIFGCGRDEDYHRLTELYMTYSNIGGYPAVVKKYLECNDVDICHVVLKSLLKRFIEESASYFRDDKSAVVFSNVFKAMFLSMVKEKRGTSSQDIQEVTVFVKEDTKEHVSRSEVNRAIAWLKYSGIVGGCDLYNQGDVSDVLNERRFYFMDCGMARYIASLTPVSNSTVEGIIAENFVYTELYRLYKSGLLKGDKPCCSIKGGYELDFMLVDKDDRKYGIEVKSKRSDKHKSLDFYLRDGLIDCGYLAEITRGGCGVEIDSIPIYTVGCRFPYEV